MDGLAVLDEMLLRRVDEGCRFFSSMTGLEPRSVAYSEYMRTMDVKIVCRAHLHILHHSFDSSSSSSSKFASMHSSSTVGSGSVMTVSGAGMLAAGDCAGAVLGGLLGAGGTCDCVGCWCDGGK